MKRYGKKMISLRHGERERPRTYPPFTALRRILADT